MRILLINSNRYKIPPVIPFGLCCIATTLEQAGHEVHGLDLCFSENCAEDITKTISKTAPDIIGISIRNLDSSTGYNLQFFIQDVKEDVTEPCKQAFSGPIVIGGPSVGINGPEMLSFLDLHYAIQGDGEVAMLELLNRFEKNLPLTGMGGLIWRKNGQIVENNPPWRVPDLNSIPFINPARYFNLQPYIESDALLQIQTKRGCALKCSYCTYNEIEGRYYRYRDPQRVADEIEYLIKETGINHIEFADSTFNVPLDHTKAVLHAVAARKLKLRIYALGINPKAVDEELADLMKELNFDPICLGVEAGNDAMIKSLGKDYTTKDIYKAGKLFHDRNMRIHWCLLLGAPGETEETIKETFETMDKVAGPRDAVIASVGLRVYKGTPISKTLLGENSDCTTDNFFRPFVFSPKTLSFEDMYNIAEQAIQGKENYNILGQEYKSKRHG